MAGGPRRLPLIRERARSAIRSSATGERGRTVVRPPVVSKKAPSASGSSARKPVKSGDGTKLISKASDSRRSKLTVPKTSALVPAPIVDMRGSKKSKNFPQNNKATKFSSSAARDDLQIPAFGFIDVCFCLDATGSMCSEIEQVKSVIESIIHNIQEKVRTEGLQLRFAIVSYRDHPPQDDTYVTKINDFTDNYDTIEYLKTISAGGGGDEPEAAHDGLYDAATKLNWA